MGLDQSLTWPESLKQSGREAYHVFGELRENIQPVRNMLENIVADHPIRAATLSLALGAFLGWLIKR